MRKEIQNVKKINKPNGTSKYKKKKKMQYPKEKFTK